MMKKTTGILLIILSLMLVFALAAPVAMAGEEPTPEPIPIPTEVVPTEAPTEVVPTPEPEPEPQTQHVDLVIYAYDNGVPADGYTVKIDETALKANADGKVTFPDLTVEQHSISITNKSGISSTGRLNMRSSGGTSLTDKAMGGVYGVDISSGATSVYMSMDFVAQEAVDISYISDSAPGPKPTPGPNASATPSASASATASGAVGKTYDTKNVTAHFADADGKDIDGMKVSLSVAGLPVSIDKTTDAKGSISVNGVPYGTGKLSFDKSGISDISLTLQTGAQTSLASENEDGVVVNVAPGAQNLFLGFEEKDGRFMLKTVSEQAGGGGGIDIMMLIIIIAIIVIGVVLTVVLVKKNSDKKRNQQRYSEKQRYSDPRRRNTSDRSDRYEDERYDDRYDERESRYDERYEDERDTRYAGPRQPRPVEPRQATPPEERRTGGGNKFEDAPPPKRPGDRSRM